MYYSWGLNHFTDANEELLFICTERREFLIASKVQILGNYQLSSFVKQCRLWKHKLLSKVGFRASVLISSMLGEVFYRSGSRMGVNSDKWKLYYCYKSHTGDSLGFISSPGVLVLLLQHRLCVVHLGACSVSPRHANPYLFLTYMMTNNLCISQLHAQSFWETKAMTDEEQQKRKQLTFERRDGLG